MPPDLHFCRDGQSSALSQELWGLIRGQPRIQAPRVFSCRVGYRPLRPCDREQAGEESLLR